MTLGSLIFRPRRKLLSVPMTPVLFVLFSALATPDVFLLEPNPEEGKSAEVYKEPYSAAIGEYEMGTFRIENDDVARQLVSCEVTWQNNDLFPVSFYRPAAVGDFLAGQPTVPDAFAPLDEVSLEADGVLELLFEILVPVGSLPGDYRGALQVNFVEGKPVSCPIRLRVFDMALPESRQLASLFSLDVALLAEAWSIPLDNMDRWAPIYDHLNGLGFAYRLYLPGTIDSSLTTETLAAHIRYVAATTPARFFDVGGTPGALVTGLQRPTRESPQDRLQTLLHTLLGNLKTIDFNAAPVAEPLRVGDRSTWQNVRQEYARFSRADDRIIRILAGPPHPHFERYADIWALPDTVSPELVQLLTNGQSMTRYTHKPLGICVGTVGASDTSGHYQTLASESVDGSEATSWIPALLPGGESPWIEITFPDYVRLESLTLIGPRRASMVFPTVETAYNPGIFTDASVSWDTPPTLSEMGNPITIGTVRYPRECIAIRLRFPPLASGHVLELSEVLFNNEDAKTTEELIPRVIPWLDAGDDGNLAWSMARPGGGQAARMLPWVCWARGFQGILGPALNTVERPTAPLLAVGKEGLLRTRRLFALRDGLEDYEYIRLYWEGMAAGELRPPPNFSPGAGFDVQDKTIKGDRSRLKTRETIGKLLSGESFITKNFGP